MQVLSDLHNTLVLILSTCRYTLPEGARAEHVTSNLSGDGVLVVRAVSEGPRKIPISVDRPIVN